MQQPIVWPDVFWTFFVYVGQMKTEKWCITIFWGDNFCLKTIINFREKNFQLHFMQPFSADAKIFEKNLLPPKTKKTTSKIAYNWLGLPVFSPASFCFVQLRHREIPTLKNSTSLPTFSILGLIDKINITIIPNNL